MVIFKIRLFCLGLIFCFASSCSYIHFVSEKGQYYSIEDVEGETMKVAETVAPYKKQLDAEMSTVIGQSSLILTKDQPESTLGNWCADAVVVQAEKYTGVEVDFAVLNYGGLRIPSLPKGNISKGKIFELMPFDNMIVVLEMKGSELAVLFDHVAQKGGWPVSASVHVEMNAAAVVQMVKIAENSIDPNKIYKIATIDYLANGGDKCTFFKGKKRFETGQFLRTAVIEYIQNLTQKKQTIKATIEGRIIKK